MEQAGDRIFIYHTDPDFDAGMTRTGEIATCTWHFSQNEDFFALLQDDIEVPSFVIHHDVRSKHPNERYVASVKKVLGCIANAIPQLFSGMHWYFDATDVLKPGFFQISRIEDSLYLSLIRIDLSYRPSSARIIRAGSNDETPFYSTRSVFIEADMIPLRDVRQPEKGVYELQILQTISETWIGETGRGYFVQGMWLDRDLSKFFTRLFLPAGKRIYPYYPLNCKYRAVCFQPFDLSTTGRRGALSLLHRCRKLLEAKVREIENILREDNFAEDLPGFLAIKAQIPAQLTTFFEPIQIRSYLNSGEFKEYELKYETH